MLKLVFLIDAIMAQAAGPGAATATPSATATANAPKASAVPATP